MRRLLSAVILSVSSLTAFAQAPQPSTVPDPVLFEVFFRHVNWLESVGDKQKAKGKSDQGPRSDIKNRANLTTREESLVKELALSCQTALKSFDDDVAAPFLQAGKADRMKNPKAPISPDRARSIAGLEDQRKQIVLDHLDRLKRGLGQARFTQLYVFVRTTERVKQSALPTPDAIQKAAQ